MGPLFLIITTFIWGTAFLAQKSGADHIGPFGLTVYRNLLGGAFLLGCIGVRNFRHRPQHPASRSILAGVVCGVPLFLAMIAQQVGIQYTTPGISAFLTTNYVIFVPIILALLSRRLPSGKVWGSATLALVGTYFICLGGKTGESGGFGLGRGEAWTILCALLFSLQVLAVDRFASKSDVLVMSAAQLFTASALGVPFLLLASERTLLHGFFPTTAAWWAIFYCGVMSSGIAYTLQNFGQARTPAALAAVLMSLEAVFGALAGFLVRGDALTALQFTGCALVLLAVILAQLRVHR